MYTVRKKKENRLLSIELHVKGNFEMYNNSLITPRHLVSLPSDNPRQKYVIRNLSIVADW